MVPKVQLKELCKTEITDGTHKTPTYADSGYIFLSSKNVTTGKINWNDVMYIPEELHNELYARIKPQKDDILLAKNGTTGVAAIVDRDEVFDIYVSLALIRPDKEKVEPRYLLHAINSEPSKKFFSEHLKGIGVPNLHLTHIRETPIKVPSIVEQKKIIDVLDKVDELISYRKEQLAKLDELVKSRFVEMFGNVEHNEKRLNILSMTDLCEIIDGDRGKNYPKQEEFLEEGFCLFLNAKNVTANGFSFENSMYITEEKDNSLRKGKLSRGDVVLTTRGTIGNLAFYDDSVPYEHMRINSGMVILRMKHDCITERFFIEQFKMQLASIKEKIANGSAQPQLPISTMNKIMMLVPDIELQNQFASFVEQTKKTKAEVQQSLEKLETLKKSLMQKYFG